MKIFLLTLAALVALAKADDGKKIVCYWGSWSVYRPGDGKFDTTHIDPTLCTHLIYTFTGVTKDGNVRITDAWNDLGTGGGKDNFNNFNNLRQKNPELKTLIAIGGWNEDSINFSPVVTDPNTRRKFVENIVTFVKKYGFDGFDVDWEYPAQRNGGKPSDKQNFVLFLKELKERFDQEGLILSAAVAAAESSASISYDIRQIAKYLDFINLMAYDLHGVWDGKTGLNAPLSPRSSESGLHAKLNVEAIVKYWLSEGAPAEKLILGVPLYGRGFTLNDAKNHGIGAPASQASAPGPFTREKGMLGYNEICQKIQNDNWEVVFDEEQRTPYAFKGNQWVGFDNEQTLEEKSDYIKELGLGGAMVWSIETDDFLGKCGDKFPLLKTLNYELRNGAAPNPGILPKPRPPQAMPSSEENSFPSESNSYPSEEQGYEEQTAAPISVGDVCQAEGYMRDSKDCTVFYYCKFFDGEFLTYPFNCPEPLVYDTSLGVCNWPEAVQC